MLCCVDRHISRRPHPLVTGPGGGSGGGRISAESARRRHVTSPAHCRGHNNCGPGQTYHVPRSSDFTAGSGCAGLRAVILVAGVLGYAVLDVEEMAVAGLGVKCTGLNVSMDSEGTGLDGKDAVSARLNSECAELNGKGAASARLNSEGTAHTGSDGEGSACTWLDGAGSEDTVLVVAGLGVEGLAVAGVGVEGLAGNSALGWAPGWLLVPVAFVDRCVSSSFTKLRRPCNNASTDNNSESVICRSELNRCFPFDSGNNCNSSPNDSSWSLIEVGTGILVVPPMRGEPSIRITGGLSQMLPTAILHSFMLITASQMLPTAMLHSLMLSTAMSHSQMLPTATSLTRMLSTAMLHALMLSTAMSPSQMLPTATSHTLMLSTAMLPSQMLPTATSHTLMLSTAMLHAPMLSTNGESKTVTNRKTCLTSSGETWPGLTCAGLNGTGSV